MNNIFTEHNRQGCNYSTSFGNTLVPRPCPVFNMEPIMICCEVCKQQFKRIQWTHLKKHNLTIEEYQEKYPTATLVDENIKKLMSCTKENMIRRYGREEGLMRWESYINKQAETNTFEYKQRVYGWTREQFDEYNKSRGNEGESNGNYGLGYYQVWVRKYGKEQADKMNAECTTKKIRKGPDNGNYQKVFSAEQRKNMSDSAIERIKRQKQYVSFNEDACKIIDEYGKIHGYTFMHGLNGGEFIVPNLWYYVDGYDEKNNIVVEYMEKFHYINEHKMKKDKIRREQIMQELGCTFIEIKYNGEIIKYEN